jgi:predicted kinase
MKYKEVILCIGIPASGKSTWSMEYVKKNPNYIRVNRDDYRIMLKDQPVCEPKVENYITKCVNNDILTGLHSGFNVIVDQTNCKAKYIEELCDLVKHFAIVKYRIFDISIDKAIERDKNRKYMVGEVVIRRMHKNYVDLMDSFDFTERRPVPLIIKERVNTDKLPEAVICDLDGTIAFNNGKRSFYDDNCITDDLSETVLEQLLFHKALQRTIIIMSGRDMNALESTTMWLNHHKVPYDHIYLRAVNDGRKDHIVKEELYNTFVKDKFFVKLVYEDRESVVEMWRGLGLKCFQADYGKY